MKVLAKEARGVVAGLFAAGGLSQKAAEAMADALVEASQQGLPAHGLMQAEAYLDHLAAGTVSKADAPVSVKSSGALAHIDAGHMFGHLSGAIAMGHAVENAQRHGIGAASVQHGFHFGAAGRYAEQAAAVGCIGIAMSNSRAVMAPPGAVEPLVGTNPLAIAIPAGDHSPVVFDMATSAGGVAKIVMARQAGEPIPEGWALDSKGRPTTDAAAALAGSLLPAAGAKGFGLSLCIDMMTTLLAGGVPGTAVGPMRGEPLQPMNASHLFIAIDPSHLRVMPGALAEIDAVIEAVHAAKTVPGAPPPRVPGEGRKQAAESAGDHVEIPPGTLAGLKRAAAKLGQALPNGWNEEPDT